MTLIAANNARLNAALDKLYRYSDGTISSLRTFLASQRVLTLSQTNAMIDWRRSTFNRLDYPGQAAYEARLKAKQLYWINDTQVPKIVFDHMAQHGNVPGSI